MDLELYKNLLKFFEKQYPNIFDEENIRQKIANQDEFFQTIHNNNLVYQYYTEYNGEKYAMDVALSSESFGFASCLNDADSERVACYIVRYDNSSWAPSIKKDFVWDDVISVTTLIYNFKTNEVLEIVDYDEVNKKSKKIKNHLDF